MHWEQEPPVFTELPDAEIPAELLRALSRLSANGTLLKARLRWRPKGTRATGFITKNRLLKLESASPLDLARALASHARYLYEQSGCEARFQTQVRRRIEDPDEPETLKREWRSITFYIEPPPSKVDAHVDTDIDDDDPDDGNDDDDGDDGDSDDDDIDEFDEPPVRVLPRGGRRGARRHNSVPPSVRPSPETGVFTDYDEYARLMRRDPTVFAMVVVQQSHDRTVNTLERILFASFDRLDRTLETQGSHSRFINEGLQTVTRGAGEVAAVGIDLFRSGLEHQAGATRLHHDTEIGKERTELMRDAVKQGSLLAQAALMSNAAKRRSSTDPTSRPEHATAPRPEASREPAPRPDPSVRSERGAGSRPEPAPRSGPANSSSADASKPQLTPEQIEASNRALEASARELLELLTPEIVDTLRPHTPTLVAAIDSLRGRPIAAARTRKVIRDARANLGPSEIQEVMRWLDPLTSQKVTMLVMQILQETR